MMIREARYDDIDALLALAKEMHAESPRYSLLRFSADKVAGVFRRLIDSPDGLLMVAENSGEIVGGMAAMVTPHWFSDDLVSSDIGLFMLPRHRGGMTAVRLMRSYIEWAKFKGALQIQAGISTGVQVEEAAALYRRMGLKQFSIGFEV
jgi:GNAT superfamily N-acetyltransferase